GITDISQSRIVAKTYADLEAIKLAAQDRFNGFDLKSSALLMAKNDVAHFQKGYAKFADKYYQAKVTGFANPIHGQQIANEFVDQATKLNPGDKHGMIPTLLDQPLDFDFGLIAAMLMKGDYKEKFAEAKTKDGEFTRGDGTKETVNMMHATRTVDMYGT